MKPAVSSLRCAAVQQGRLAPCAAVLALLVAAAMLLFAGPVPAGPVVDAQGCTGARSVAAVMTGAERDTPAASPSKTVFDGLDLTVADAGIPVDLGLPRASQAYAGIRPVVSASYAEPAATTRADVLRAALHRPPRAA